jgi:alpha-N-arabinofuranosidase
MAAILRRISVFVLLFSYLSTVGAQDQPAQPAAARLVIRADQGELQISRHIYGHFAEHLGRCIYDGLFVGGDSAMPNTDGVRSDVLAALKELSIPNLRWPGGCFADNYHWRDGIGPVDKRPLRTNVWWENAPEPNTFGTHEFLNLCERLGAEPVIAGNVGSAAPSELADWVEYVNSERGALADERRRNGRDKPWNVSFWGIGNESWGCGGNMTPEYYSDLVLRYSTFVRPHGGTRPVHIASGASDGDYRWTEVLMRAYRRKPEFQGLSLHHYTLPTGNWGRKGSATRFDEGQWASTLRNAWRMDELVRRHAEVMDQADPQRRVMLVVDEWGTWYDAPRGEQNGLLYQQNTLRDALVAGITLNVFNNHCGRVRMANLAQTVNVLQAVILTRGEQMALTPTYYVMRMYRPHQDATMLPVVLESPPYAFGGATLPAVSASASRNAQGRIHISLTNANPRESVMLDCRLEDVAAGEGGQLQVSGEVITAGEMADFNDFGREPAVKPAPFRGAQLRDGGMAVELPAKSVVMLRIDGAARPSQ